VRDRSTTRGLVWVAIAGQAAFVASWVVAGALEPGYSGTDQFISELASRTAEHPAIVTAGIVLLGLSFAALGVALGPALPRGRPSLVAAGLFVAAGASIVAGGAFPLDCEIGLDACRERWEDGALSWRTAAHAWAGLAAQLLLLLTPFAVAWALWPAPSGIAALGAGLFGVAFAALHLAAEGGGAAPGVVQRIGLGVLHLWVLIVAVGILYETRRPPPPGRLVPIRPRDFLALSWSGEGELLPWPFVLGRRLARPFRATREATWVSDSVWRFDDASDFGDGRVLRRQTFCEFVGDDHVRLTAGDLPDGADVWIEEGGYRLTPFRMAFPIGPVPVYIRVHDMSYADPDGTFVNVFEARTLVVGLPLARVVFRVRPLDDADAAARQPVGEVHA
jgi:Protein of unknown function (DUF998)